MVAASTPTAASSVADAATSPKAAAELVDSAVCFEPLVHVGGWGDHRRRVVRTVLDARSVGRFTRSVAWTLKTWCHPPWAHCVVGSAASRRNLSMKGLHLSNCVDVLSGCGPPPPTHPVSLRMRPLPHIPRRSLPR